jgi:hypothetical protein
MENAMRIDVIAKGAAALALIVAASGVGIADASAATVKPPPPTGRLLCDVGVATLKTSSALTNEPSTKLIRLTFEGSATCDSTGVTGGKAPITEATFKFTWTAGKTATCSSLPSNPATKSQRFRLKLRGVNAKNQLITVATVNGTQEAVSTFYNGFTNRGTARDGDTRAFPNHEVVLSSYVSPEALTEQCEGSGLTELPFVGPLYIRVT